MKKLVLDRWETNELRKNGVVEIIRSGFNILVENEKDWIDGEYRITIINPYDKVVLYERKEKWKKNYKDLSMTLTSQKLD